MNKPNSGNNLNSLLQQGEALKVVVDALAQTITKYTHTPAAPGKPFIRKTPPSECPAVGGLIRFERKEMSMVLFLGLSKELFLSLYNSMFQMEADEVSSENADLAGEILNISFGVMDPKLREMGFSLKSSLPVIYFNEKLQEAIKQMSPEALVIPYSTVGKTFQVEIYSADSLKVEWKFDQSVA